MNILCVEDEHLALEELQFIIHDIDNNHQLFHANTTSEAFIQLMNQSIDLIFLDIQLANESGLDFAQKIQELDHQPLIVFATAYEQYALEAFQANAIDYILKPYDSQDIQRSLNKAQHYLQLHQQSSNNISNSRRSHSFESPISSLTVKHDDIVHVLNIDDIVAIGIDGGLLSIHTHHSEFESHDTLQQLIKKLPPDELFQVHRSFYIRLSEVRQIQAWFNQTLQVTLSNGLKVPVSRNYVKAFKSALNFH